MAIFPTPRLVLTEEDSLKTHSLGSILRPVNDHCSPGYTYNTQQPCKANFFKRADSSGGVVSIAFPSEDTMSE
ncbi:hypothetical protein EYF80_044437 [Liparis tanakae]|uniref:Uncharacterized protein n=1 Tax=Liparis tanakae TaxID=230148 RepID=A0A4Z2FWQ9_9TELE|nr:hypothetical protein EYF80_044437 [Liparis tanakae]